MEKVICIKSVTTKSGIEFKQGNSYELAIHNDGAVVYSSKFEFVKIKSESTFNKFFK